MPMPSANGISIMDKEYSSSPSAKKSIDELKRQVTKLKAELESERSKLKQVHRDKTTESKRIQENSEKERHKTIETVTKRLQNEHSVELRRIRETLAKDKDNELRQVLKFKDEELKAFKQQINEEKDRAKRAEEDLKRHVTERSKGSSNDVEKRLRDELSDLKEQKRKLDELYRLKCAADFEKAELIRRLKGEHEREVNELIRQSKREVAKEYQHLRSAEKALEEKNHELAFKEQLTRKLEAEKQEIRQRKSSEEFSFSESPLRSRRTSGTHESTLLEISPEADDVFQLSNKGNKDKERELRKKNAELQSELDRLEKKCTFLEKENASRQTGNQKASSLVEEKVKKLKKRNSELVSIARQLEEKAKKLQEEKNAIMKQANSKDDPSAEVEHMKKMFARQRAKDLAEHAKIHMEKDNELDNLRKQLVSLSDEKSYGQAQNDKIGELQSIITKTAKERLLLEKKLASVGSPCSSPLSPPPARMHSLEKRLESYTNQAQISEKEAEKLEIELKSKEKECKSLKQSAEELTVKCSKLELEREKFAVKCTMLHQKNVELGKRIKEINQLEEEIKCLKQNLQNVKEEKHVAEQECKKMKEKLEELMHVKEELKASEKHRKELEAEHTSRLYTLKEREEEIRQLRKIQEESTRAHRLAVTSLEQDLRNLEQKCADSDLKATNSKNELEKLKSKRSDEHKATQTSRPSSPVAMVTSQHRLKVERINDRPYEEIKNQNGRNSENKDTDILDTAASRIKQLTMSDSEEDSHCPDSSNGNSQVNGGSQEDDIAVLSRRINQAAMSDDSSVSAVDNNYDSDASRDVNSMAEGDMADMEDNDVQTSFLDEEERNDARQRSDIKGEEKDVSHKEVIDEIYLQQEQVNSEDEEADKLSVFIARYSYDPFQHSPNDNPQAELAFQAGDYLYVFGDVDDDGFYLGELMNGQRGLVPSNFVEKIADESDMAWMTNGVEEQQSNDISSSDEEETFTETDVDDDECKNLVEKPPRVLKFSGKLHRNLRLNVEHIPDSKLGDIEEEDVTTEPSHEVLRYSHGGITSDDTDLEPGAIPSPKRLVLSRQFTRSVLLNWKPADLPMDELEGYKVYVNGELKVIIKGGHNTKALIEDIDPNETYRVSVRTITTGGDESLDQEAMLTIGKDVSSAPTDVKVSDILPTSAKLEWLPSNSSFSHEILVNGTPRHAVTPGTRHLTLTNLEPAEHYRIHVRAKNPSVTECYDHKNEDSLSKAVEFTTQQGGLPDPPLDVHLVPMSSRSGPNTLEVSWIPVTITEQGMSNGSPVTGYKVYINDFLVAEVTSPTADGVTVASWMIERAAKKSKNETLKLVVRTQSSRGESISSNCLLIPVMTFNFHMNKQIGNQPIGMSVKPKDHSDNESKLDSGKEQQYQDDNHNFRNRNESDVKERKNLMNEFEKNNNNINDGSYTEVIPKTARTPPIPKPRTKGKPVVWKMEVSEEDVTTSDSGESNKGEHGGSSNNEEDEQIEICGPGPLKKGNGTSLSQQQQQNEQQYSLEEENNNKYVDLTEKNVAEHSERRMSELSDIDLDELNDSLNSATSFKRDEKRIEKNEENKEPFKYPLELSDSEVGDSSDDEPLSVIDEVEEIEEAEDEAIEKENGKGNEDAAAVAGGEEEQKNLTESAQERSRSSPSTSDGFQSDDDVMDLLGEEAEDSQDRNLTAARIRKISKESKDKDDINSTSPANEPQTSVQKYLVTNEEPAERDGDNHLNQTYSDIEADQRELIQPNETSTPRLTRAQPGPDYDPLQEQSEHDTGRNGDEDYGSDAEENRTYIVSEKDEAPIGEDQEEEIIRIFIALYDYDPATMSPNPGAEEDELTFNEGDLIKIYGDKDEDGFYWGELDGMAGFVPHNMVSEVQVDDEDLLDRTTSSLAETHSNQYSSDDKYQQPQAQGAHYPKVVIHHPSDSGYDQEDSEDVNNMSTQDEGESGYEDPRKSVNYSLKPKKMVALFDYDPQLLSPNPDSEVELRFRSGDIIYVYGDMDDDGFYTGEQGGVRGLVPSNFLEDIKEDSLPLPHDQDKSFASQENSDDSFVSQESPAPGPSKTSTPNGTQSSKEETPKKKKSLLSKGKLMLKKMTKSQNSKR